MGLDTAAVKLLCAAKSLGVNFTRTAMIGRQSFFPRATALRRVFSILEINRDAEDFLRKNPFSEAFFSLLGAQEVISVDYSSYEGADVLHDMNVPLPDDLRGRFSAVFDGGSLEHVFDIPQAFKNCMEMVQVGGHFTQATVANNYMGHGFWQISPDLIFRAFSPANGYQIEAVLLHEVVPGGAWYVVTDPDKIQDRVQLCNSLPTYMLTVAKRVAETDIFALPPQQGHYVARWGGNASERLPSASHPREPPSPSRAVQEPRGWRRYLPGPVRRAVKHFLLRVPFFRKRVGFNRPYYRRISEDALLRGRLT